VVSERANVSVWRDRRSRLLLLRRLGLELGVHVEEDVTGAARMPESEKSDRILERSRRLLAGGVMAECPSSLDAKRGGGEKGWRTVKDGSEPWRMVGHGGSNANVGWRRDRDDAIAIMLSIMPLARVRLLIFRLVLVLSVALLCCVVHVSILPHELHISSLL